MNYICFKFLTIVLLCQVPRFKTDNDNTNTTKPRETMPYEPPKTISYPFGDEKQVNNDMLNKTAVPDMITSENQFTEYKPECSGPLEGIDELYVACLKNELSLEQKDILYSSTFGSNTIPVTIPGLLCQKCDIRKNPENTAVIIECFGCFDLTNPSNRTEPK